MKKQTFRVRLCAYHLAFRLIKYFVSDSTINFEATHSTFYGLAAQADAGVFKAIQYLEVPFVVIFAAVVGYGTRRFSVGSLLLLFGAPH